MRRLLTGMRRLLTVIFTLIIGMSDGEIENPAQKKTELTIVNAEFA